MRHHPMLLVVLVAITGCGGDDETSTSAAPSMTSAPETTSTVAPVPLELVYFSDSSGWGVAKQYAALASEELGVPVTPRDFAQPGLSAVTALQQIRAEAAAKVAAADIIVIAGNPFGSGIDEALASCPVQEDATFVPPAPSTEADWAPYRRVLDEIYAEVWMLRDGKPTVLRAVDIYNPALDVWRALGVEEECTHELEMFSRVVRAAAEANGATMVSLYDLLNGPGHDRDLKALGYILPDGMHTSDTARALIAEALAATGFEPSPRPAPSTAGSSG